MNEESVTTSLKTNGFTVSVSEDNKVITYKVLNKYDKTVLNTTDIAVLYVFSLGVTSGKRGY